MSRRTRGGRRRPTPEQDGDETHSRRQGRGVRSVGGDGHGAPAVARRLGRSALVVASVTVGGLLGVGVGWSP